MEGGAVRLGFMLFIGLLLIQVGMTGKLGSLLASIIDPANMQDTPGAAGVGAAAGTGTGGGGGANALPKSSVINMITSIFGAYGTQAAEIAAAESSLNSTAINASSGASGLFQIMPATFKSTSYANGDILDATTNIKAAYEIFKRDGYSWREWTTASKLGLK